MIQKEIYGMSTFSNKCCLVSINQFINELFFYRRLRATNINIYRSGLTASLVKDLPNVREYIYTDRHRLIEEKRIHCQIDRLLAENNN